MNDPNVVTAAPNVSALLEGTEAQEEGLRERARATMLGLAVGNLLGLPVESWHFRDIDRSYAEGITDIDPREAVRPMDDDLAQAVDLGEVLVEGGDLVAGFADRLLIWANENGRGMGYLTERVIGDLEAGYTPLEAARREYEDNLIASNGAVMRCAPVALARHRQPGMLVSDSAATCVVTHYASTCQWSCIIINTLIAMLLRGARPSLPALISAAVDDGAPDMLVISLNDGIPVEILSAIREGTPDVPDASWLRQDQGKIGHTLLAMQCGLWAAVTPLDLEAALIELVSVGGDTDTNAAVAGAVLGARYGVQAIPQRWLECIPGRGRIEGLAVALMALSD